MCNCDESDVLWGLLAWAGFVILLVLGAACLREWLAQPWFY